MRRKRFLFCIIILILLGASKCMAWEQVYKVIPNTTTWLYEWRYVGQIGVGTDTTTVNAFMHWGGLIQGTTIATSNYTFPSADGSSGQVPKTNGAGVVTWQNDLSGGGGASTLAIEEDDVQVSSPTATIDFRDGFDVTESPSYESNVVVDPDEVITAGTQLNWSGHTLNVDLGTGTITQAYDADLDDLADGTLSKSKVQDSGNWDNAYGWGDHSGEGYLTDLATGTVTQAYDADLDDLSDGTLSASAVEDKFLRNDGSDTTSGVITCAGITSSGQVTSNNRKVTDTIELDAFYIIASTTIAGTTPVRISAYHDFAITITTMTVKGFGATTCVGMIEQRARASDNSAGTDIWSGDVTISTTTYSGESIADYTIPAGSALWFVPTSWAGDVDQISFDGKATKD